ncbi:hypothetical protein WJX72_005433 [[Myrmecia] bisecta]|uniref:Uncharacterized protein n=1 Tax=[Myrmecia] bisecta TaxID=41462 RepID=A0AAW1PBN4_9CHLO
MAQPEASESTVRESGYTPLEQVLFVEVGWGADQHGQSATKAVVRACRNAIEFNSIPSIKKLVPNGYDGLKLRVKVGTPYPEKVDLEQARRVFPYGQVAFEVVEGGLNCCSGIAVPALGDTSEDMLVAVAAVTVGY